MNLLLLAAGLAGGGVVALCRPRLVLMPPRALVGLLAAASAAAAVAAAGAPTGNAAVDVAARAALGAGFVLLAAHAGLVALLLAAAAAVVVSVGSPVQALAGVTLAGLAIPAFRLRRAPLLTAGGGAALAQVALHLRSGGAWPSTATGAAWVMAPVAVWGLVRLDPVGRRRVLRGAAGLGALAVAAGCLGVVSALVARPSLNRGLEGTSAGIAAARRGDTAGAARQLSDAARSFAQARRTLDSWWARPADGVPVAAQHVRSLRAVAATGRELSVLGADAARGGNLQSIKVVDGQVPLDRIPALERSAGRAVAGLARARRQLAAARSPWLVAPLTRRLAAQQARLADAQGTAERARGVLHELPALLGAAGPRRYFLAVQTPAELRGSGGMIGNYGEITAEGGRLRLARFGRLGELNEAGDPATRTLVAPDDYVARYSRLSPETLWQNVTASPDFPTVAGVIANLYPQSGGVAVDGVIAVDPSTIAALLSVVGPLTVPPWPEPLTAQNAARVLLFDQYVNLDKDARVQFLGDTVEQLWSRLTTGALPGAADVLNAVGPVVPGKHLMLASTRASEQRVFEEAGVAGRMAAVKDDFVGVVTQNTGENKIDWFLRRQVDYSATLDPATGDVRARLKVVLHNDAPSSGLPAYVIGNPPDLSVAPGDNRLYLSVYTPWSLDEARIDGVPARIEQEHELERRVYSAVVVIPAGGSVAVDLRLSGRTEVGRRYQLDLHRQPSVAAEDVRATLTVGGPGRGGRTTSTRHVTLDRDRTIRFPVPPAGTDRKGDPR